MSTTKLAVWTLCVAVVTYVLTLAVVAPRQAEARDAVDGNPSSAGHMTPTRQVDIEAAFHACSTLTARLEADTGRTWAD